MHRVAGTISLVGLMAGALALGGCATQEAVEHAQATADQAMMTAQAAGSAAQRAQSTADGATSAAQMAQSTADGAASAAQAAAADAKRANDRLDQLAAKKGEKG